MFMVCFNNVINPFIGYDHKNCIENFGQIHVIVNEVNVNYSRPFFTLILLKYNTLQHNLTYLLLESEIAYFIFLKNKLLQHYTTISSVSYQYTMRMIKMSLCIRSVEIHTCTLHYLIFERKKIVGHLKHILNVVSPSSVLSRHKFNKRHFYNKALNLHIHDLNRYSQTNKKNPDNKDVVR